MTAILSAVETEQLRELRARLNRIAKGPLGDKSVGPLSKGFFDLCARVGLLAANDAAGGIGPAKSVADADMPALALMVASLQQIRQSGAEPWRRVVDSGMLQTVLTRRLVMGGREQPAETGVR